MGEAATDLWVWVTFVVILGVSGLIAYLGDLIGRRIGRKRLSIFGLRPRNTAIVFTILTGIAIAVLSVITLLTVSEGARQRILRYTETVTSLERQVKEQEQRSEVAERYEAEARRLQREVEAEMVAAQRELQQAEADVRRAGSDRQRAERSRESALQRRDEALRRGHEALRRWQEAQQRYRAAQRRVADGQRRAEAARRAAAEAQAALARKQAELTGAEQALASAEAGLQNAIGASERVRRAVERELEQRQAELDAVQGGLSAAREELDAARLERDRLYRQAEDQRRKLFQTLVGEVVVESGEELARSRFLPTLTRERVLDQLDTLVRAVERAAQAAGAQPGADGRLAVLYGIDPQTGNTYPADAFRLDLSLVLSNIRQPVWLRAISLRNTVRGEQVEYSFRLDRDRLVFSSGEVVVSTTFDAAQDEVALALELQRLIQQGVNPTAQSRGLLPNPEGRRSVVGPETWLPALRRIQEVGGRVRVEVLAVGDIYVGDELNLQFRVTSDAPSP